MESRFSWVLIAISLLLQLAACVAPAKTRPESSMSISQVTPEQAKRLLDEGGYIYLDVRTVAEFVAGHPPSAYNIPVAEPDPMTGRLELNPRFLPVVEASIPRDAQLIVGCRTGGRSMAACEILAEAGYKDLRNLDGGFAGVTDSTGQVIQEGWSTVGQPVERGDAGAKSYASLSRSAGQ